MKFKIKSLLLVGGLLSLILSACEDFDKLNVDPNNPTPETVDPNFLLTSVQIHGTLDMHLYQRIHNLYVDNFAQYFVNDKYTSNNCVPVDSWNQDYWDAHWGWICSLNDIIKNYNEDPLKVNSVQIARIWKVWLFHRATDIFGDIPYFNAANGSGEAATYDPQKDIYYDMLKELAESSEKLDDKFPNPGKNDLIFRGDILMWKKFANSLRLRLAMRLTEVDLQKAKTEAESAVKTALLLSGNSDNVKIFRSDSYLLGKNFQYANSFLHNGKRLTMSKSMEKLLSGLGGIPFPEGDYLQVPSFVDPRGPVFFNVTSKNNGASTGYFGKWTGVPAGLPVVERELPINNRLNNARLGVRYISKSSVPGPITYENSRDMFLMNYSEVCFLLAEGAARGWNMNGTAEEWYERGVVASMTEAGITSNIIDLYLKSEMPNEYGTTVAFDKHGAVGDSQLEKIITQKYIANFPDNAWEAWNDFRRLNMPNLDPFVAPQPGYVVEQGARDWKGSVRRINYPPQESILNKVNYDLAVSRMGGDKTTSRMWWDAKK